MCGKREKGDEADSGRNRHEENTEEEAMQTGRGRRSRNNKNANDLTPGSDDKGINTQIDTQK